MKRNCNHTILLLFVLAAMSVVPLFQKSIVGMIHVGAMPGTPRCKAPLSEIVKIATQEAALYKGKSFF